MNMKKTITLNHLHILFVSLFLSLGISIDAQVPQEFIFGDQLPDAPILSERGDYKVGVRTMTFINKDQIDILSSKEGKDPTYDRDLKVEIWYPAELEENQDEIVVYDQIMGNANSEDRPLIPFTFKGRAARDAKIKSLDGGYPLVVVSHGYTGSRLLMTYLTENLASKGYVVVAIDHKESTFADANGFHSTLLNRPKDILFILNEIAKEGKKSGSFLNGNVDADNTAIVGYSMGGYGVLNVAGAGYSEGLAKFVSGMSGGSTAAESLTIGHPDHTAMFDTRIKAVVAFAPWGMERGIWDEQGLKGLKIPTFFVAGNLDDVSGYEKGIKAIYDGATNVERYLLTYDNARHNVAPNPPAPATLAPGLHFDEYYRYAEPAWDERRINNINQHFVTAFIGSKLKNEDHVKYLDLKPNSNEETWEGFAKRTSTGLELLHTKPVEK